MATKDKKTMKNFLFGGDSIAHHFILFWSNLKRLFLTFILTFLVFAYAFFHFLATDYQWHIFKKISEAHMLAAIGKGQIELDVYKPNGELVADISAADLLNAIGTNAQMVASYATGTNYFLGALALSILSVFAAIIYYIYHGKQAQEDKFVRGQKLVTPRQLIALIKKIYSDLSPLKIGEVFLPLKLLMRNVLFAGSMGVGKSVGITQVIEDARSWKKKMIIYDKSGEFAEKFYRDGHDFLLNIIDKRCENWSIFADLRNVTDPATVSTFFVPKSKAVEDDTWGNLARMLLEDLIIIVRKQGGTMKQVAEIISQSSLEDLHALLKANNAQSTGSINPENPRGSESVRLTLSAQPSIRFFRFFDKQKTTFSVRDFVHRKTDACLFLTSAANYHEACRPFISVWLELAIMEAMSLPPTQDVRLIIVLDELASLQALKLDTLLTEGRKYGIVTIVGIQNLAQMDELYGKDMTKTFLSNLQNKHILRCEEADSADRLADNLGKEDVESHNNGQSMGVETTSDKQSVSQQRNERHLVTGSEIMILPDLTGYLKIAGAFPIAQVSYKYKARPSIAPALVERDGLALDGETTAAPVFADEFNGIQAPVQVDNAADLPVTESSKPATAIQTYDW